MWTGSRWNGTTGGFFWAEHRNVPVPAAPGRQRKGPWADVSPAEMSGIKLLLLVILKESTRLQSQRTCTESGKGAAGGNRWSRIYPRNLTRSQDESVAACRDVCVWPLNASEAAHASRKISTNEEENTKCLNPLIIWRRSSVWVLKFKQKIRVKGQFNDKSGIMLLIQEVFYQRNP